MTAPQLGLLRVVHRFPESTLGDVGRRMYLHISTVSGIVDRLEAAGYLTRRRGLEDRRVVKLLLTVKGRRTIAKAPPSGLGIIVLNLQTLPTARLRAIRQSMHTLLRLMEARRRAGREPSRKIGGPSQRNEPAAGNGR